MHAGFLAAVVLLDLIAVGSGVFLSALLRFDAARLGDSFFYTTSGPVFVILAAFCWIAFLSARGAYAPRALAGRANQLERVAVAGSLAWLAMILAALWLKIEVPFDSRLVMGASWMACVALVGVVRLGLVRPLARRIYARVARGPALILASGDRAAEILARFEEEGAADDLRIAQPFHRLGHRSVRALVEEREFREVIIAPDDQTPAETFDAAFECLDAGASVRIVAPDFRGLARALGLSEVPEMQLRRFDLDGPERVIKRAMDIFGAAFGLIVLSPLFAAIALAVKLGSRGPAIYRQQRIGKAGRPFRMYKFRTMDDGNDPSHYEDYVRSFILEGRPAEITEDGARIYKPMRDPRVTRAGALLRRYSLDELPQLWNVLRGEMSLVGPRPCLPYEWSLYQPWQRRRFDVLPGCTGLWQIAGRSRVRFEDMIILDLYYAHHGTLLSDVRLILKTVPAMLFGQGAY